MIHKAIGVAAVGALAFGLASCGDDGDSNSEVSAPMSVESDPAEDDLDLRSQGLPTSAQQSVDIAAEHVGEGGIVHTVEIDYSDSVAGYVWTVKILREGTDHKIPIDAANGEIVQEKSETTSDTEEAISLEDSMTLDEAMDLAAAEVDGPVGEWKLEYDDDLRAYEFDIAEGGGMDTTEVKVDVDSKAEHPAYQQGC
ncbi:MAG: PepSY domain-containing protein [Corynebacterium sp.]|nr:PepSY domain-containing protein [Corynebacterium sp.]